MPTTLEPAQLDEMVAALPSREGDRVIQFREALREALAEEMRRDKRVFLMGDEGASSARERCPCRGGKQAGAGCTA